MKKILLLWNESPDLITAFILDEDSKEAKLAVASAGMYINSDDLDEDHEIFQLNEWVGENKDKGHGEDGPIEGPFERVIICGFVL